MEELILDSRNFRLTTGSKHNKKSHVSYDEPFIFCEVYTKNFFTYLLIYTYLY